MIQSTLRHKESCSSKKSKQLTRKCNVCDFLAINELNMKRHNRDVHEILTDSVSPPPKKKKEISLGKTDIIEEMEIDEHEKSIKDLSFKLEEMDIDDVEEYEKDSRSKMMDEKVKAKADTNERKEKLQNQNIKAKKMKKKHEEEIKMKNIKQLKKQQKQKIKNDKKKRRTKAPPKTAAKVVKSRIPNIKPVPQNCLHLVNKGDLVYTVPGDGSCGPSSASAHLFKDEVFGPTLRRRMNKRMAKYWHKRYKYITKCSKDHPFVRKLGGGGEVRFDEPEKLIEYLKNSEEAALMWTDSEDLAVISDMYQIKIKIITTKGENDKHPVANWIHPSEELKEYAELKNVELNEMVLLHENDSHFNLIVSKDNELVSAGSLSYRSNIGPMKEEDEDEDSECDEVEIENNEDDKENDDKTK